MLIAAAILLAALLYLLGGLLFSLVFLPTGVGRVDPASRGTSVAFRLMILPGTMALWPLLARRWWTASKDGSNR